MGVLKKIVSSTYLDSCKTLEIKFLFFTFFNAFRGHSQMLFSFSNLWSSNSTLAFVIV